MGIVLFRYRHDTISLIVHLATVPLGIWILQIGLYRSPFLQVLWGWSCMIGSSLVLPLFFVCLFIDREGALRNVDLILALLGGLLMAIVGHLLIRDREISSYRRHLTESNCRTIRG